MKAKLRQKRTKSLFYLFDIFAAITTLIAAISFYIFYRRSKYNIFSYKTIFTIGFALFVFFQAIVYDYIVLYVIPYNPTITENELIILVAGSGFNFMLLTLPFILVFSISISISNIFLIKHEGKRKTNFLGIVISLIMLFSWIFIVIIDINFHGNDDAFYNYVLLSGLYSLIYSYFECMLFGTIICALIAVYRPIDYDLDFIVILGCKIKNDGTLYPLIKGRTDKAIEFYNRQKEVTGKELIFIPSGGKGNDEIIPEGEAIKNYLLSQNISKDSIIVENMSATTRENLVFSTKIMQSIKGTNYKAAFSTTNYHVLRSGIIATSENLPFSGIGAKTKWYFWPNAFIREFAGLLVNSLKKQIIILSIIICLFIGFIYLSI